MPQDYIDGRYCHRHKKFNLWQPAASGGEYARCPNIDPITGIICDFFRRKGATSPAIPAASSSTLLPGNPDAFSAITVVPLSFVPTSKPTCIFRGCGQTNLAGGCGRKMCKAHCRQTGGCSIRSHALNMVSAATTVRSQSDIPNPSHISPLAASIGSSSVIPSITMVQTTASESGNPRYISHMTPLMSQQWSDEQRRRDEDREKQKADREMKERRRRQFLIHVWLPADPKHAKLHSRQGLSDWPNFRLTRPVLTQLGFPDSATSVDVYHRDLDAWVTNLVDDYIILQYNDKIFLKCSTVEATDCFDFPRYLHGTHRQADSGHAGHNSFRHSQPKERAFVKKATLTKQISSTIELFSDTDDRLTPEPSSTVLGKRRASSSLLSPKPSQEPRLETDPLRSLTPDSPRSTFILTHSDPMGSPLPLAPLPTRYTASPSPTGSTLNADAVAADFFGAEPFAPETTNSQPSSDASGSGSSNDPYQLDDDEDERPKRWPQDFKAKAVVLCFKDTDGIRKDSVVESIFHQHFDQQHYTVRYNRQTYRDHRDRWFGASLEARKAALEGEGQLWSQFMRSAPAKGAVEKAAKRQLKKYGI
ncbi:hypothetical protein C8J56DRAFT_941167 [Mycena floridula]|nr:hypothetical protein C8J56DRAFT_941167 [Mycena floridula]